jgi:threonine dehydrogenase-like Zn-dependent dehydrogenase
MNLTALAHVWISRFLREGDLAVDATAGNGHDTLFLARCVGCAGRVVGFDIQPRALEETRRRLEGAGMADRVILLLRSHREIAAALAEETEKRAPQVIVFNLGYLPGGEKKLTTRAEETVPALEAALGILAVGGAMSVMLYPGHPEGKREAAAVNRWAENLTGPIDAILCRPANRGEDSPCLLAIEKRSTAREQSQS